MNGNRCDRCGKSIFAADKQERYEGKIYHSSCFTCSKEDCRLKLTTQNVRGFGRMPFCRDHVPSEASNRRITYSDHIYVNVPTEEQRFSSDYDEIGEDERMKEDESINSKGLKKEIRTILKESSSEMIDDIFSRMSRDLHIVVCGSPRVGKSTLINVICGKELAKAKEGLASVTQKIECYTTEGQCDTGSNLIHYKYNIWDTPGFESWERDEIKSKVKEILEKPDLKPVCLIFCASPGTFVDLNQLEWLLNKCITKRRIFCALVCTNKYAGSKKSRQAVLDEFNRLLTKVSNENPRVENEISYYGNVGLCGCVNSVPFDGDERIIPAEGINELIYGIMQSLVDEQFLNWCFIVLENQGFWNNCQDKLSNLVQKAEGKKKKILEKIFFGKKKQNEGSNFRSFLSN